MLKSGWIGFIRGDDFWERAADLAKMGYKAMDSDASFVPGEGSLADKVKRLRDMGVEPLTVSAGFDPEGLKNGLADLIEKCKVRTLCASPCGVARPSRASARAMATTAPMTS